jgi:eukaryotic-like serine/threonine-protein kinase
MLRYFISREFFLTILGLIAAGVLVYLLIFMLILPAYTRHGKGLTVPDVTNMSIDEAMAMLEDQNLEPQIADSVALPCSCKKGQRGMGRYVVKQYPQAYSRVKSQRLIALTVPMLNPQEVELPNIIETEENEESISESDARSRLQTVNLCVKNTIERPSESDVVLEALYDGKKVMPGEKLPYCAEITLVVGSGKGTARVQIPDLEGYPYEEAISILNNYGLGVGVILYDPKGPEDQSGLVYDQNPRPGFADSIRVGESVDLYIYGAEPTTQEGVIMEKVQGDEGDEFPPEER